MTAPTRFIGMDIHRQFVMVAAVDAQQQILLEPIKVPLEAFTTWADTQLRTTDQVALEATTYAWTIYDSVQPLVAEVTVADAHKISLISRSPRKTDQHDALILAKLLAAHLLLTCGGQKPHLRAFSRSYDTFIVVVKVPGNADLTVLLH